ncbi:MAG: B12-binding domain-containing radical SAM protein [Deltaproteobacteria bacterium]|nr:B12-binding domain-containing radical SAM protein [Deltaproteobacteria bacterium]MCL5277987.1 B12-binding domain-containing radical SAM protein [Deltaproteobacteria bacterium]
MKFHLIFPKWPKLPVQTPFTLPPLGIITVAASLPDTVAASVCDENVQPINFDGDYDGIGISIMLSCQAPRAYEIAAEFRKRGKPIILGGLHVSLRPDEAMQHADSIVIGEAEGILPQVVRDFQEGRLKKSYSMAGFPDIAKIPNPRRDLYDKKKHYVYKGWELVDLVQTSRGCRFNCYPCCVPYLGGRVHRMRPISHVVSDMKNSSDLLFIVDNSLEQNVEWEKEVFRSMAGMGKRWVSHPISPTPEVLNLARKAGCWYVYHAIYTISDKIKDRIKMFHDYGIGVEGTILLGMDEHTEDFIKRFVDFLLTVDLDLAEFTVLTPFPGTQVYEQMKSEDRIFDTDWNHYNASTVVFQPKQMTPETLQRLYYDAWDNFYKEESQSVKMSKLFLQIYRDKRNDHRGRHRDKAVSPIAR